MARSASNAKLFSAFVVDRVSVISTRRGYATAASSSHGIMLDNDGAARTNVMLKKGGGEDSTSETSSWVPDPVTGYYRPENQSNEIDAAERREMLLKHKN